MERRYATIDADYEVVRVVCPWCSHPNSLSRISDLHDLSPISYREVRCGQADCGSAFSINGDTVGPAYQMFLYGSYDFIRSKRYSFAVLSAVQSLEVFFDHAVRELWLLKVFDQARSPGDLEELNEALELLFIKTTKFAYQDMRNLFFQAAVSPRPGTVREGRMLVEAIPERPPTPGDGVLEGALGGLAALLIRLKACTLHELRNQVVHKRAYRPTREQAEGAIKKFEKSSCR